MDCTGELIDTIFTFSRRMKEKMGAHSDIAYLSMVQLQTLHFLRKNPNSPMRKIADYLHIELPSATNLIDKLVKLDFVGRKIDTKDKRLVNIALTKKGTLLLTKAIRERRKNIEKILTLLTEKEKQTLLSLLQKLTNKLQVA